MKLPARLGFLQTQSAAALPARAIILREYLKEWCTTVNTSEFEHIWKQQEPIAPSQENLIRITASVREVDRKFRRKIWWRDLREIGAVLVVAGFCAVFGQTWLRWISVASSLFVAAVLIWSRLVLKRAPESTSVIARLDQMIRETEMQIKLLRSVLWWYLLPCAVATIALVLDHSTRKFDFSKLSPSYLLVFGGVMVAFYLAAYWLNQRAVQKFLEPRRAHLRQALAELSQKTAL
jgi:hypothetical protein